MYRPTLIGNADEKRDGYSRPAFGVCGRMREIKQAASVFPHGRKRTPFII